MKYFFLILYASTLFITFYLVGRFESQIPGDLEWAIYYGILLLATLVASIVTKCSKILLAIASMAPLVGPGAFVVVTIAFSAAVTYVGILLAGGLRTGSSRASHIQTKIE